MPTKRTPPNPDAQRLARLEAEARHTATRLNRVDRELADDRLGRIERATESFQATVRGAFTVQQDQIAKLYRSTAALSRTATELSRTAAAHEKQMSELRATVNQVVREWQAYLRTIHPPQ